MTSGSKTISLQVEGAQDSERGVKYPNETICAVSTFSVSIPCYYYYPRQNNQVTQMLWCALQSNTHCQESLYVYNSSSSSITDFKYIGDNKSDCTLLIHNVQFSYSGKYKFNFITNVTDGGEVNNPGVTVQFTDLKVSLIRLSGNGTLKPGDSLNLTCDVTCTQSSSQFVWFKNNEQLNTSEAVLHFPALTLSESGNYTCTWKTNMTSGSKTISLQVEGENPPWPFWIIAVVAGGGIILVIIGVVICLRSRKDVVPEDNKGKVGEQTQVKQVPQPNEEVQKQEEVTYASVCVKSSSLNKECVHAEQQRESISIIYSAVAIK
ncbi:uncharacterized protein LOC124403801 isoform X1 [Silurus meridionalis]|nr:uncharacterized protein LOC124403801 isoform X1 [Silurus meridionalis]